jgi:hypothetical protein
MRRKKAVQRGRAVPILVAAGVGYLIGVWNAAAVRSTEAFGFRTAAQTVAMRFPQALNDAPVLQAATYRQAAAAKAAMDQARLALFEPEPMTGVPGMQQAAIQPQTQAPNQQGLEQTADISPLPPAVTAPQVAAPVSPNPRELTSAAKPHPAPVRRQVKRPDYMLDDAQIADIKRRLHLTPDQEQMWPAVAAALRNIGAENEREARWRGTASDINPDSPQVQDLKSAAIPLLMSFSDEQKDQVRDLARGMGLNQLASEF